MYLIIFHFTYTYIFFFWIIHINHNDPKNIRVKTQIYLDICTLIAFIFYCANYNVKKFLKNIL